MVKAFCKYYIESKRISGIDNPFIQELNLNVFSRLNTVNDSNIQQLVAELKKSKTTISVTDFGAGSKKTNSDFRSIGSIVKNASVSPKFGKLINLLVSYYDCKSIIELGTSLGVGTSYLALNNQLSNVFTIEGCPNISEIAQVNLNDFDNVSYFVGEFSNQFSNVLDQSGKADLVYIDGNHTQKATVDYFNYFLLNVNKKAILVFDDIHWSRGMELAWEEIKSSQSSRITIDLFRMGVVFLDPNLKKEHFVLRF